MTETTAEVTGHDGARRVVPIQLHRHAIDASDRIHRRAPWLMAVGEAVRQIAQSNKSSRKRLEHLRRLADRIAAAVEVDAACKVGCNACCHIRVEVTQWEAHEIAREVGARALTPSSGRGEADPFGKACGFLADGRCSIYAQRPIACRLHHSLGLDETMCGIEIDPAESFVPKVDLRHFWAAFFLYLPASPVGDLSEFIVEAARAQVGANGTSGLAMARSGAIVGE